jgi:hypothetical protein
MYSWNMMNNQIAVHRTYRSLGDAVVAAALLMTMLEKTDRSRRR